jgi:tRNA dimethylallyltransferase
MHNLIVILGPTASGKTNLAVQLASTLNTEIISADSRQIFRGMDIGTGKDLDQYIVNQVSIPYHLIDIRNAGDLFNVSEFQLEFWKAFESIKLKGKIPILCGGTGMYIDSILKDYQYTSIPKNPVLQLEMSQKSETELLEHFHKYQTIYTALADLSTRKRLERAIQINHFLQESPFELKPNPKLSSLVLGLNPELEKRREKITNRLNQRLQNGLIEEVNFLLQSGILPEKLIYYGLEYKFVTQYVLGQLSFGAMFEKLKVGIHQYAKRQMTYFRKMERDGIDIKWLDPEAEHSENIELIKKYLWNQ